MAGAGSSVGDGRVWVQGGIDALLYRVDPGSADAGGAYHQERAADDLGVYRHVFPAGGQSGLHDP